MCVHVCVCLVVYSLHGHEHVQKEGRIPLQLAPYCTNCQRLRVSLSVCVRLCVVFARCGPSLLLYKHEARLDTNYTTAFKVGVVARSLWQFAHLAEAAAAPSPSPAPAHAAATMYP